MYLRRVQIPDFRVLKNIDLSFEEEFIPHIFPVASLNGGGKSTLLQLIFVLLHCSGKPERLPYLKNMLEGIKSFSFDNEFTLAKFDILHKEKSVSVEFLMCKDNYLQRMENTEIELKLSSIPEFTRIKRNFDIIRNLVNELENLYSTLQEMKVKQNTREQRYLISKLAYVLRDVMNALVIPIPKELKVYLKGDIDELTNDIFSKFSEQINEKLPSLLKDIREKLQDLEKEIVALSDIVTTINHHLNSHKLIYIMDP